jgi:isoquinoline 1-oxidoreductase beta subunit
MSILETGVDRRQVLKGFLIAGPTLAVAARLGFADSASAFPTKTDEAPDVLDFTDIFYATETPSTYDLKIEIKPDNRVYFEYPRMDIGQGVITSTTMMVADNLDVPMENMDTVLSPAEQKRAPYITGGSKNTRVFWEPVRVICAQMRGQLMAAAATKMGVPVTALRTEDGYVVATDGRKLSYGELTADAAKLPVAKAALPKNPSEYKYIGKAHQTKYHAREIATGQWKYSTDLFSSKEFLPTVLAMPATHGAAVVSIDDSEAKKIKGVIAVTHIPGMPDVLIPEAVAVTAVTTGIAKKAKEALRIKWSAGPMDAMSDAQIDEMLNEIIDKVASPGEGIEAVFRWPYVTHAPMQENAACADVRKDSAEIWGSDQIPTTGQRQVAETLGMKVEQVKYNCVPGGGAFGRHTHHDEIVMAAQVSQRIGKPVKLQWLREEGIQHGRCRPVSIHHVKATIANNEVMAFEHRMAGSELDLRHGLGDIVSGYVTEYNNAGASNFFFTHTQKLAYKFGPTALTLKERLLAKPTAPWRVVYSGPVGGSNEIVIDELARSLGKDEFEFRMQYLDSDRHRAVLEKCAHEAQWGKKLPEGVAQGIGMHDEYKSISAYIMEIDTRRKSPRLNKVTIAVDCGYCVNPSNVENQMVGQAMDGFATVFQSGLHIDNGATRETNFHNFKWPRMFDSPLEADVHIIPSTMMPPGGIGEVGTPAATAAAANAWARATGKQPRNFPLNEYGA